MATNPPSTPDDPLDGLAGVHTRLRGVCALLELLAGGEAVEAAERRAAEQRMRNFRDDERMATVLAFTGQAME